MLLRRRGAADRLETRTLASARDWPRRLRLEEPERVDGRRERRLLEGLIVRVDELRVTGESDLPDRSVVALVGVTRGLGLAAREPLGLSGARRDRLETGLGETDGEWLEREAEREGEELGREGERGGE